MLFQTHKSLDAHFSNLSRERGPLGYPVYAFEHGMDATQIAEIRQELLRELARSKLLSRDYWLLWTVLAAEVGYNYDGDEYWDSFQSDIPIKITLSDREIFRDWFRSFAKRFNGFRPTGRWAKHFSIIAWPITHSILPRYLQSHFARHLYELRHDLAANDRTSPDKLGELLGDRYHGESSRFENFLQQTALTARLVLALRDEDREDAVTPIYKPTLARIVHDLEQKGLSRSYLRDARRVLRDARLRAQTGLGAASPTIPASENVRRNPAAASQGVKLIARSKDDGALTLGVALPDIPALMASAGIDVSTLDKSRAQFVDRPDSWMPARALLSYSNSNHALASLPNPVSEPVIRFREIDALAKPLIDSFKLTSRSPWLLRVHDDGVAREVLGNHIRTGAEYVIVSASSIAPETVRALGLRDATSQTADVYLYRLTVPSTVNPHFIQALQRLGFGYALRARIKAFGLTPRWNNATGRSVWTVTENIVLHLYADFSVTEFAVSIDGNRETRLPVSGHNSILVSLGTLPLGTHTIQVVAVPTPLHQHAQNARQAIAPETITIDVRAPVPWQKNSASRHGLRIVVEPKDASLDDVVDKRAEIIVHGPRDRTAHVEAHLYDFAGHISSTVEIGRLELPTQPHSVVRLLEKLSREPLSEHIQSAPRVALSFVVDEIGAATVSFRHGVAPLRWKLSRDGGIAIVRLVDEAGVAPSVTVNRFDVALPDKRVELDTALCLQGITSEPPGSLYIARHDGRVYTAFVSVPPQGRLSALSDLATPVTLSAPGDNFRSIMRLLALLRYWRRARPHGSLGVVRKANVIAVFEAQIERLTCGARWADKTARYRSEGGRLEELQRDVGGSPGFASRMRTTEWTWHADNNQARREFARLARTYEITKDAAMCDLALRLAFNPAGIKLTDPKEGARQFEQLAGLQTLTRGAYFAKMTSDLRFQQSRTGSAS